MGIFDKIKKGAGLDYLESENPKKPSSKAIEKVEKKSPPIEDRGLRIIESKIQKIIEDLQEIRAKLRVRRGI